MINLILPVGQLSIDNFSHIKNIVIALVSLFIAILLISKSKIILPYH